LYKQKKKAKKGESKGKRVIKSFGFNKYREGKVRRKKEEERAGKSRVEKTNKERVLTKLEKKTKKKG
jgi:hypothetical protein